MAGAQSSEPQDGLPIPQRYWAALAVWLAITMAVLDGAVVNVALPTIARQFRVDPSDVIWIVNAYQIAIVVSLLPLASLGEIWGYRRVYLAGLALFTAASLGCAASTTLAELTLARIVQGLGAAGVMAINAALIRHTYPARLLGRGIGFNAMVISLASAFGPTLASGILAIGPWQWLFAVNVPLGALTLVVAALALPRPPTVARRFDALGAGLNAFAFGFVIGGADLLARTSRKAMGVALVAAGLACGLLLARRGRGQATPLLPLDLLAIPIFSLSIVASICCFCAQMLALVSLPFAFEGAMGRTAVETGLLLSPWPVAVGIAGPLSGHLSDRMPAAYLGAGGLLAFAAGLAALALMPNDAGFWNVAWRMGLCGLGFGFFQTPNNRTMVTTAPRERSGAAGGLLATARLTGQTAGATLVAVLFALRPADAEPIALTLATGLAIAGAAASLARAPFGRSSRP